jgi:hypothetical protein
MENNGFVMFAVVSRTRTQMAPNLAEIVEADLAADDETRQRATEARREGGELDTDWEAAFRRHRAVAEWQRRVDTEEYTQRVPSHLPATGDD